MMAPKGAEIDIAIIFIILTALLMLNKFCVRIFHNFKKVFILSSSKSTRMETSWLAQYLGARFEPAALGFHVQ